MAGGGGAGLGHAHAGERQALGGVLERRGGRWCCMALVVVAAGMALQPLYLALGGGAAAPGTSRPWCWHGTDVQRPLSAPDAAAPVQALAVRSMNWRRSATSCKRDMAAEVAQASRGVEQERNRLAALMSELTQSVVVCNLDGRMLLYNNRARMQFRALSPTRPRWPAGPSSSAWAAAIYTVFDRKLVAHALESVQQRLQRGAAHPRRSSSPPRAAASCCACRWRRCVVWLKATARRT
jgi:DNA polymerase-3 subunit epsilon